MVSEGGIAAAQLLERHEVDAVIIVAAPEAAAVNRLLSDNRFRVASLDHVEGLTRRFPYFRPVTLKRGSVDPRRDLPSQDINLLATTANLVVRDDLHPALAYLLLEAAQKVHRHATLINRFDEFPAGAATEFPRSDQAERYFKSGSPFLQSYLPFWVAVYVQRLILLLVPLAAILLPLAQAVPKFVEWRRQRRLFRRYAELKRHEQAVASHRLDDIEREARARLDDIEKEITQSGFPLDLSDRVYTLRQHIDYVRAQLDKQVELRRA